MDNHTRIDVVDTGPLNELVRIEVMNALRGYDQVMSVIPGHPERMAAALATVRHYGIQWYDS
jgi:hypothetical protein